MLAIAILAAAGFVLHVRPVPSPASYAPLPPATISMTIPALPLPPVVKATPIVAPLDPCPELDLDGDGTPEQFETVPDSCGTGGCVYKVYLHGKFAGRVEGRCEMELQPRKGAPHDILATWRLGANETVVTRYWFKGGRYRPRSDFSCTGNACTAEHWIRR